MYICKKKCRKIYSERHYITLITYSRKSITDLQLNILNDYQD